MLVVVAAWRCEWDIYKGGPRVRYVRRVYVVVEADAELDLDAIIYMTAQKCQTGTLDDYKRDVFRISTWTHQ